MKYLVIGLLLFHGRLAVAKKLEFIKEHSKINFEVEYMQLTSVSGVFKDYQGQFDLNEKETEISNINFIINSSSINTNDSKRDFHLKDHEFLFTTKFPEIKFSSKQNVKLQKNIIISGVLILRGIEKNITFKGKYKGKILDPWGKPNYFFEISGEINRKDFQMVWNKELDNGGYLVGDQVKINLNLQAQFSADKTAFSTHMIPATKGIIERDLLKKGKIKKLSTSTKQ